MTRRHAVDAVGIGDDGTGEMTGRIGENGILVDGGIVEEDVVIANQARTIELCPRLTPRIAEEIVAILLVAVEIGVEIAIDVALASETE